MVILVLNYVACAPVLIAVGVFSLYHLYSIVTNATTIEGWEKDKVASLKRKGKIREVRSCLSRFSFSPPPLFADLISLVS
jgi:palmitoyltransferase